MARDDPPGIKETAPHRVEEVLRERLRRSAIDSAHFFGLAALYEERGKRRQAVECLEIARHIDVVNPYAHKLQGKILFRRKGYNAAAAELRTAWRYNPFDRETAELIGRVEYERERYREALEATIDAFLLVDEADRDNGDRLKKRIRTLKTIQRMSSQDLVALFRERRDKLQTAFDRLEWQREQLLREVPDTTETPGTVPVSGQLLLAHRLRRLAMWSNLTDDQIYKLSLAARNELHTEGTRIFEYGSSGADIYALEEGEIGIYRPTSYGTFHLGTLTPGSVFGEVNFIAHGKRSGDAVATRDSTILRLDAQELELVIEQQPDLGVQIYAIFWQDLARKLRGANEQLRSLFSADSAPENFLKIRREETVAVAAVGDVRSAEKIALLREQGLSGSELRTLANFSKVKRVPSGTYLFQEGEPGHEMYAVLDGQIMISKYIEGGGDEALAILERGDFFGEMALIDGEPRSADAKAHQGAADVVAFDDQTLREVIAMDPLAALDFMKLLCRLISKRLREIDEKVIGWRIMSGSPPEEGAAFVEEGKALGHHAAS